MPPPFGTLRTNVSTTVGSLLPNREAICQTRSNGIGSAGANTRSPATMETHTASGPPQDVHVGVAIHEYDDGT